MTVPSDLYNALTKQGATPVYYLVFHFDTGDEYISDRPYVTNNNNTCSPLVIDWGTCITSVALDSAVKSIQIPTTDINLTIANTESTGWFCSRLNVSPIENTEVSFYITAEDATSEYLIDKFIVTDPISYSESSLSVSLSIITKIFSQNKFIGSINPVNNEYFPLVVGSAQIVVGSLYGNQPVAQLVSDLAVGATTIYTDRSLTTAGFPSSGTISLGYDYCSYTGISGNNFTGVLGVGIPLSTGDWICNYNTPVVFAYGTGPVEIASPLYVNGEIYTYDHIINKNSNPVQVLFLTELPYSIIPRVAHDDYIEDQYLTIPTWTYVASNCGITTYSNHTVVYKNNTPTYEIVDGNYSYAAYHNVKPENDDLGLPADAIFKNYQVYLKYYSWAHEEDTEVYAKRIRVLLFASNYTVFDDITTSPSTRTLSWTGYNYDSFKSYHIQLNVEYDGYGWKVPVDPDYEHFLFELIEFTITVNYEIEDSPAKKVYTVDTALNIGSSSGSTNPATLIQSMISAQEPSIIIDSASFTAAYNWFDANNYSFSGVIEGNKDYITVIKELLYQSRSFLTFGNGKVYLNVSLPYELEPNKILSLDTERFNKSISIERQPLSEIVNKINIRYDYDYQNDSYSSSYVLSDTESISILKTHEVSSDCYLITSSDHAESLAEYYISDNSYPKSIISFSESFKKMNVEIGNVIVLQTDFCNIGFVIGKVIRIEKDYVNSSNVTKYNFTIVGNLINKFVSYSVTETLNLVETIPNTQLISQGWSNTPWSMQWSM